MRSLFFARLALSPSDKLLANVEFFVAGFVAFATACVDDGSACRLKQRVPEAPASRIEVFRGLSIWNGESSPWQGRDGSLRATWMRWMNWLARLANASILIPLVLDGENESPGLRRCSPAELHAHVTWARCSFHFDPAHCGRRSSTDLVLLIGSNPAVGHHTWRSL